MTPTRGAAEPMQERARRTRRAILLAAAEAFAENGYLATTTSDIAARAGVTKGALVFHFPAKAGVAVAIVEECYEQWPTVVADARLRHERMTEVIGEVLHRVAMQIREDPIVRATVRLQAERALIGEPVRTPHVAWTAAMTELFQAAERRGELRSGADPAVLGRVVVASFHGVQHVSGSLSGHADVGERVAEWWAVFRAGFEAGPETESETGSETESEAESEAE
ncbi:ScbR family autoregulator-binding transcription factor [Catenulispora yoronensis]|uniref:ScbR family autoregulator-binding transcription factor n=1 Tax=Catenulispora yoronensis TaxID=450799 RepID=A0ABN2TWA9_9ACTN